jgi:hypothetical protein
MEVHAQFKKIFSHPRRMQPCCLPVKAARFRPESQRTEKDGLLNVAIEGDEAINRVRLHHL